MKSSEIQALIAYRMEKSKEAIKAAEIMLENNMLTFAMNRIYYSMFYAVQSLLASDGVSFSKHGQVKGAAGRFACPIILQTGNISIFPPS